ncbi:hypothetical protein BX070DRAFT_258368 [Coemansia spiralis]|nr:hypothetical protein BX070DRAFT_258368 [Coemansia spiralis]
MNARAKAIYENCRVLDITGKLLFRTSQKRLDWYLVRSLASRVDDRTIRLKFANKGVGRQNEPFYLQDMRNECVICGTLNDLTMHHVVPHQYRQYMEEKIKSRSSHDLLPVCMVCHDTYERHAVKFKKHLSECFDAPLGGRGWIERKDIGRAKLAASALLGKGAANIPESRRRALHDIAHGWWTDASVLRELCEMEVRVKAPGFQSHGEMVVGAVDTGSAVEGMCRNCNGLVRGGLMAFVAAWRKHFVEHARPTRLPEHWDTDYPIHDGDQAEECSGGSSK